MSLTAEQIAKNYEKHLKIIDHYIGDRGESIKAMLKDLEGTYVMAPASGKSWYHVLFLGYLNHSDGESKHIQKELCTKWESRSRSLVKAYIENIFLYLTQIWN